MKVFVTGATGVIGQSAVRAILLGGHEVSALARSRQNLDLIGNLGATAVPGSLFDVAALAAAFAGHDVVCNLATAFPTVLRGARRGGWRANDRVRQDGSRVVAEAAAEAGVSRLVQESVSLLYADGGDRLLDEDSALSVTKVTESAAEAEAHAQAFDGYGRSHVVLRLGQLVGDDNLTRWRLRRVRRGRPVAMGPPDAWVHPIHAEDAGTAVLAALSAPGGRYNAGAAPIRNSDFFAAFAEAQDVPDPGQVPSFVQRLLLAANEQLTRSQRVSSERLMAVGWKPRFDEFGVDWFAGALAAAR